MKKLISFLSASVLLSTSFINIIQCDNYKSQDYSKKINFFKDSVDANTAAISEQLGSSHSELDPKGIFVEEGTRINYKITINDQKNIKNLLNPYIAIGVLGNFTDTLKLNYNLQKTQLDFKVLEGSFIAKNTGLVFTRIYLKNEVKIDVTVQGNLQYNVNVFKLNDNSINFWNKILNETVSGYENFFTILEGKNTYGYVQTSKIQKIIQQSPNKKNIDWNKVVGFFDLNYTQANLNFGLNDSYDGVAHSYDYPIAFWNNDKGAGYSYTAPGYISLHGSSFLAFALNDKFLSDRNPDWWGIWHETGHSYQNKLYNLDWWVEINENINSYLTAVKVLKDPEHNDNWVKKIYNSKKFKNQLKVYFDLVSKGTLDINNENNSLREYWKKNYDSNGLQHIGLIFWVQLLTTFGDQFFPTFNQYYRTNFDYNIELKNNKIKSETLAKVCSIITHQNLTNFFTTWGFKLSTETLELMKSFGKDESNKMLENVVSNSFDNPFINKDAVEYLGNYQEKLVKNTDDINWKKSRISKGINSNYNFMTKSKPLFNEYYVKTEDSDVVNNRFLVDSSSISDLKDSTNLFAISSDYYNLSMIIEVDEKNNLNIYATKNENEESYQVYFGIQVLDENNNIVLTVKSKKNQPFSEALGSFQKNYEIKSNWKIKIYSENNEYVGYGYGSCQGDEIKPTNIKKFLPASYSQYTDILFSYDGNKFEFVSANDMKKADILPEWLK